jgi:hypothetical protein
MPPLLMYRPCWTFSAFVGGQKGWLRPGLQARQRALPSPAAM